ncbi:MAG: PEP-CTERM sorting domain-containing protein [Planctomycetia bacterium]|nr:PEP-CTERM sorting domain-containing protein [Planctomycetia bacterium]
MSDGSTLTLDGANLSLTGNLFLAGSGAGSGSLVRTSETVSAASLSLANGAALTYRTGDSITTTVAISGGGRLTLGQDLLLLTNTAAYTSILVSGSGSELVTGSFHYSANSLTLDGGPSLTYRPGDSITDYLSVGNGSTLTLDGANLSLAGYLALSGSGSLVRTSETVSAAGLDLYYGASLTLGSGDVIRNISIYGGSLTATTPLALDSLSMYSGLLLLSNNFTGTGGPRPWGLALTGSNTSLLESYLSQNLIQFTGVAQVGVLYDSVSNMTYVMAVPEPSTLIFTGIGLTAVGATARRRRRRKSNR